MSACRRVCGLLAATGTLIANLATAQAVAGLTVSPPDVDTSVSSVVTLSSIVDAGSAASPLLRTSVRLYEVDSAGTPLEDLGLMYDDGSHGDLVANDGIFTAQITVKQSKETKLYYRATAAYSGVRNRIQSAVQSLSVLSSFPDAVVANVAALAKTLQSSFDNNVATQGLTAARQQALQAAISNPAIGAGHAFVSPDGSDLGFFYSYVDPKTGDQTQIIGGISLRDPSVPSKGAGAAAPVGLPAAAKTPQNDKLLIFAPFYSTDFGADSNFAMDQFGIGHFMTFGPAPISVTKDQSASLEVVKQWGEYSTVIVDSHGSVWPDGAGKPTVVITTGTPLSEVSPQLKRDLKAHRIGEGGHGTYAIYPSFITAYIPKMKNTFFYLGACDSMFNSTMWDALKAAGAKIAFGWTHSVGSGFDATTLKSLLTPMLPAAGTTNPLNAAQAYAGLASKSDTLQPGEPAAATLVLMNSPDWQNQEFVTGPVQLSVSGSVAGYSPIPSTVTVDGLYNVSITTLQAAGDTGCTVSDAGLPNGERGSPVFSTTVSASAKFSGATLVSGLPTSGSVIVNRRPCSSFLANLRDSKGNGKVWINATGRGEKYQVINTGTLISDWEYQLRYYSGDPALNYSDASCQIGVVPNANFFSSAASQPAFKCALSCNENLYGQMGLACH